MSQNEIMWIKMLCKCGKIKIELSMEKEQRFTIQYSYKKFNDSFMHSSQNEYHT